MPREQLTPSSFHHDVSIEWSDTDVALRIADDSAVERYPLTARGIKNVRSVLRRASRTAYGDESATDINEALSTIQSTVDTLKNKVAELEGKLAAVPPVSTAGVHVTVPDQVGLGNRHLNASHFNVDEGFLYLYDTDEVCVASYAPGKWESASAITADQPSELHIAVNNNVRNGPDLKANFDQMAKDQARRGRANV